MNQETIDLFPIPVVKLNIGDKFSSEFKSLQNEEAYKKNGLTHHFSTDKYILNKDSYSNLKKFLSEETSKFMFSKMNIDAECLMTQSWVNWNRPREFTHMHTHPNSVASGVLYIQTNENNNSIFFHQPYSPLGFRNVIETKFFNFNHTGVEKKYCDTMQKISLKNGDFIIFPSYLPHSVPMNNSNETRISLAFNSVTKGKLGSYDRLTEMDYKILAENS